MPKSRFNTIANNQGSSSVSNSTDSVISSDIYSFNMPNIRHNAKKVNPNSTAKKETTVYEPWVDIAQDLRDINGGKATRSGELFIVNGRTYKIHNSTVHPVSGPGFHNLDRGAYKALGVYNKFGNTERAQNILSNMGINDEAKNKALEVWVLLQED